MTIDSSLAFEELDRRLTAQRLHQEPQQLQLEDNRIITYSIYGDKTGEPWFWFHGAPSCRLEALLAADWAKSRGIRLIAADRPGYGGSTPYPGCTVSELTPDILALANELSIDRFVAFGGSGGGPYALACAHALPERLLGCVVVATGGIATEANQVAGRIDRIAYFLARRIPFVLRLYFWLIYRIANLPTSILGLLAIGAEKAFVTTVIQNGLFSAHIHEVFKQGTRGAIEDFARSGHLGFRLPNVRYPVLFVQGLKDPFVPAQQTRRWSELVPNSQYIEIPEAGHAGAIFALNSIYTLLHPIEA
ncbi:MAG: alpha/beta hydrolase [Myxococcales bacterium]|nr:alpha/beta hydrolase [Myxococcales bacterium]